MVCSCLGMAGEKFKRDANTGEFTADQAANEKTTHPTTTNRMGRIRLRFFLTIPPLDTFWIPRLTGPFACFQFPDATPPCGVCGMDLGIFERESFIDHLWGSILINIPINIISLYCHVIAIISIAGNLCYSMRNDTLYH